MSLIYWTSTRARARQLKLLHFPGAGVEGLQPQDLPVGCYLCNVYEHEIPISEYVLMVALMHATQVERYAAAFREGRWEGSGRVGGDPHGEIYGKTVGIIGYGRNGREIGRKARALGMKLYAIDPFHDRPLPAGTTVPDWFGGPDQLNYLLESSDFLVLACPLDETTRGLIGACELEHMQANSYLINIARAEIVEEKSLYNALANRRIAGAALDVWYTYPQRSDAIKHESELPFHQLPNVLATPHLCAWTTGTIERRISRMAENLNRLAAGQPLERVLFVGTWSPVPASGGR